MRPSKGEGGYLMHYFWVWSLSYKVTEFFASQISVGV